MSSRRWSTSITDSMSPIRPPRPSMPVEHIHHWLHESNEASKTLHAASAIHNLHARMDNDITTILKKAKLIKLYLKSLNRANAANHSLPYYGLDTSIDCTTSIITGL
ncbi:hypothetical protein COCNU_13G005150 [Cocos nucifera]|uniref:Syntaxin N-terminal domain-containing protein n=1 Tax=Cocos nucifera TaxID=13894 RepID=A0A8K0ITA2_COCNU|nr:hypothetical protein COCNU_13G005150 [Cocos nucifera]